MKIERRDITKRFGSGKRVARFMLRNAWQCDSCLAVTGSDTPIEPPSPCTHCGNICFVAYRHAEESKEVGPRF